MTKEKIVGYKAIHHDAEGNECSMTQHVKCMWTANMQNAQEWLSRQPCGSFLVYLPYPKPVG